MLLQLLKRLQSHAAEGTETVDLACQAEIISYLVPMAEDILEEVGGEPAGVDRGASGGPGHPVIPDLAVENFSEALQGFFPELCEDASVLQGEVRKYLAKLQKRQFVMSASATFNVPGSGGSQAPPRDAPESAARRLAPALPDTAADRQATGRTAMDDHARQHLGKVDEGERARLAELERQKKEEDARHVTRLCELVPSLGLDRCHMEYVYAVLGHRNMHEASQYLMETFINAPPDRCLENVGKLKLNAEAWDRDRRAQEEVDRKTQAVIKRQLVDQFDLQLDDSKKTHKPVIFVDESHKAKRTTYRFLDGQRIAMKNGKDKFVIEKAPEWDGGSRGRVKTKRKGGVGWV